MNRWINVWKKFQVPSAVVLTIQIIFTEEFSGLLWYNIKMLTTFLVIFGKTLNFPVIYLSSQKFRDELYKKLKNEAPRSSKPSLRQSTCRLLVKAQSLPEKSTRRDQL